MIIIATTCGENLRGGDGGRQRRLVKSISRRTSHKLSETATAASNTAIHTLSEPSIENTIFLNHAAPNCINSVVGFDTKLVSSAPNALATLSCIDNENNAFTSDSCFPQENFEASTGGFTCGTLGGVTYGNIYFLLSGLTGEGAMCTLELVQRYKQEDGDIASISLIQSTVEIPLCSL